MPEDFSFDWSGGSAFDGNKVQPAPPSSFLTANPFADEAAYRAQQTKDGQYIGWKDYQALMSDWGSQYGGGIPEQTGFGSRNYRMGYGEGVPQFKTANNLYSLEYSPGGWEGGTYSGGDSGATMEGQTYSPGGMSLMRFLTEQEAPGGWALSIDPYTGKVGNTVSTHGTNSNFFSDLAPLFLTALGANYLPGLFGAGGTAAATDAAVSAAGALQSAGAGSIEAALGSGVGTGSLGAWGAEQALEGSLSSGFSQSAADLMGNAGANIASMTSQPVTDTLAQAAVSTATDAGGGALNNTLMGSLGDGAGLPMGAGADAADMAWGGYGAGAMDSAVASKALFPGLEALFSDKGFIGQNKNLLNLLGTGYSIYSNGQKADALKNLANQQNNLAQQNINAQKATQDTLMNAYNTMYAPGSPEYNQMQQTIARQDAQAGRNSQYGPRAESLAAKIAGIKGNLLPQIMSAASSGTNQAYASALSAMNSSLNPAMQAANTSSSQLAPLFAMFGQASQQNNGIQSDPQTLMKIIQMMAQKNT